MSNPNCRAPQTATKTGGGAVLFAPSHFQNWLDAYLCFSLSFANIWMAILAETFSA